MGMDDNIVDVDKIWKALGQLGKFQMKQMIITLVSIWSCGFHVLSIVFIGKTEMRSAKWVYSSTCIKQTLKHTQIYLP